MVIEVRNTLHIRLRKEIDESYDIVIGTNLFERLAKELKADSLGTKYAIITDSNVGPLYAGKLKDSLKAEGLEGAVFTFKAGEENKARKTKEQLEDTMFKSGFGRDSAVIALGGGVTGDLAGFVASTYNRGIPFVQVPTTVMAMADSSIGGKTGINTKAGGKNSIGIIQQPFRVYMDISMLKTLGNGDFLSGLAEMVKHGVILNLSFFEYLERNVAGILARDDEILVSLAKQNCFIKGSVIEQDSREKGLRQILNYGHTIGHAIEQLSDYMLGHGEVVSIGMVVEGRIASKMGLLPEKDLERQVSLLNKLGLPTKVPPKVDGRKVLEATAQDKKTRNGKVMYALPKRLGEMESFKGKHTAIVEDSIILESIEESK